MAACYHPCVWYEVALEHYTQVQSAVNSHQLHNGPTVTPPLPTNCHDWLIDSSCVFSFPQFFFVHRSSDAFSVQVSSSQQQVKESIFCQPYLLLCQCCIFASPGLFWTMKRRKHGKGEKGDLVTMEAAHILTWLLIGFNTSPPHAAHLSL